MSTTTTTTANGDPKDAPNAPSNTATHTATLETAIQEEQAAILASVIALTTLFSTAAEALTLIHPSASTHHQKLALTRLGLEQGRLLIFGDVVGISSPPATIATQFVPSHAGLTNPDPSAPINFGARDARLDEEDVRKKVEACLEEIVGRPEKLGREDMMATYGLKPSKRLGVGEQAVDLNRLEAFREKYALLQDLSHKKARIPMPRRGMSMVAQHWTVKDVDKFNGFINMVKAQVDELIDLFGVQEQVERGMKIDIKSLGWHPDLSGATMKRDWAKLKLIREACEGEYPLFVQATDMALRYINQELRGNAKLPLDFAEKEDKEKAPRRSLESPKRPGFLGLFSGSWGGKKKKGPQRSLSNAGQTQPAENTQRSMSEDMQKESLADLELVRSKSLSAMPGKNPVTIDSVLVQTTSNDSTLAEDDPDHVDYQLKHADTANSLVDRHDMWKGPGRVPTKDIRWAAKSNAEH
ncbi:uncharacterized protein BDZ99DRAFT_415835 [Mytilinidion resinicola]|uniref:Prion-inhibition and propagation HeLo domain-containing protein n=1 Tax=Mytilinidion resinicola TaxID=574789 RepID=A0A6A6YLW9_9PEZI|nr:uncharacterized protein BDZ99DRAFT_415835 [Mytilinidion resinicola]KAF2809872.1 hypothetical protein BDZ99DRAFT_415835 [Mytilinidion resinicola]